MKSATVKRIASRVLGVGENKVYLDSAQSEKIKGAMTKEDVTTLIGEGAVKKKLAAGTSRGRARVLSEKKKKGRKSGRGKRKGKINARTDKKTKWIRAVRAQRKVLKKLKDEGTELKIPYGTAYKRIKGGLYKGKKYVEALAKEKKR